MEKSLAAMAEAEQISRDPSVKGYRDITALFEELDTEPVFETLQEQQEYLEDVEYIKARNNEKTTSWSDVQKEAGLS